MVIAADRPTSRNGLGGATPGSGTWRGPHERLIVAAGSVDFGVLRAGNGPPVLLLHGTGASAHSWRGLGPLLARRFSVIAPDLPGHGDSELHDEDALSLTGMARAVGALLDELDTMPVLIVGHSAGAALAARLVLDQYIAPRELIAINGAFLPFGGVAGSIFSGLAHLAALNPLVPWFVNRSARHRRSVERLMRSTGSTLDEEGLAHYQRLLQSKRHVEATLKMMARWDLGTLRRDLVSLRTPLNLIVGVRDATVPPWQSDRVALLCENARVTRLDGLGHLAHEEAPERVHDVIMADAERLGLVQAC